MKVLTAGTRADMLIVLRGWMLRERGRGRVLGCWLAWYAMEDDWEAVKAEARHAVP